jgi:hypothetical protein
MTYETIRGRLDARPFQPFRVVTSSGQAYEVRHPEMAFPTRTEMVIASAWLGSARWCRWVDSRLNTAAPPDNISVNWGLA